MLVKNYSIEIVEINKRKNCFMKKLLGESFQNTLYYGGLFATKILFAQYFKKKRKKSLSNKKLKL